MSACTCYAMIGHASREGEGLRVGNTIRLVEGSRPAWKVELPIEGGKPRELMWIPSLENTFDDLVVMIGLHIIATPALLELAKSVTEIDLMADYVEVYSIPTAVREQLYAAAQEVDGSFKLGLIVFDSCILEQGCRLEAVGNYSFDVEICRSTFRRLRTAWNPKGTTHGSLD
jgi:hypothetical protein